MLPDKKKEGLLRFLTAGLITHSQKDTVTQLGDRSLYVGLSDIGKGIECMRSAVADKAGLVKRLGIEDVANIKDEQLRPILRQQLILQRGHWQEFGIQHAIEAVGAKVIPQLEISTTYNGVPIKAHLDFTIVRDTPCPTVRILELKSNEHIPEHLYASYEAQLYGQIGLLYECWNEPCFSTPTLVDVTFPELAQQLFNIKLPINPELVDIEGWVVSISMSNIKPFGPYIFDRSMLQTCYRIAEQLWTNKDKIISGELELDDLSYTMGFHPLCDFCAVNRNCPKFESTHLEQDTECERELNELAELKEQERVIASRRKAIEQNIKVAYQSAGLADNGWINNLNYRFRVSPMKGRKSLNQDKLAVKLKECIGGDVDQLMDNCLQTGKPYERLYVSRIN